MGHFHVGVTAVDFLKLLRERGYATALFGKYHSHDYAWGQRAFEHEFAFTEYPCLFESRKCR